MGSLEGALQVAVGSASSGSREREPSGEVPVLATSVRTLKDEDAANILVAHICGELVRLLLVADGHGGPAVAQLCATVALRYLVEEATALGDASAASVHAASVRTFEHMHERAVLLSKTAGATLTIAVWNVSRGELTVAHAGDSSAILVEAASCTLLTDEHRLNDSPEERTRVQARASRRARLSQRVRSGPDAALGGWASGLGPGVRAGGTYVRVCCGRVAEPPRTATPGPPPDHSKPQSIEAPPHRNL